MQFLKLGQEFIRFNPLCHSQLHERYFILFIFFALLASPVRAQIRMNKNHPLALSIRGWSVFLTPP